MSFHVKYTQTKNDVIYLQFFNDTYLVLILLFYLILTCMNWLQPRKRGMHFILSDNGNYDLDIKIGHYGFMDFIIDVIDFGCLEYIICFRIKEKKKKTHSISNFILQCSSKVFYFYFSILQLTNYNENVCAIYNCFLL